jgi:glucose/arabinose dehydrogenase
MSRQPLPAPRGFHPGRAPAAPGPRRRGSRFRPGFGFEPLEERLAPATLLPGFTEATVASGFVSPAAMEFAPAPDGRVYVLEQGGNVKVVRADGSTWTALHLNVDSNGERGLLGIAFDPGFAANHYVYLYYTNPAPGAAGYAAGEHNQISRFTVDETNPQQPVLTNEAPVLDLNTLSSATNHNGGAIHFGLDGMLYADAGDNVQTFNLGGQTYRVSQTLGDLLGKQLRINVANFNAGMATRDDTTVGHLIPVDNPFVGVATGINQLIYALGLRNPFTFAVQPGTGTVFINDVGENVWEEINRSVAGANYGWSGGETDGFGQHPPGPGVYHDPLLAYNHVGGPAGGGIAIVGGTFYNPVVATFPASYVGEYFYGDLAGWIRVFNPADPGSAANPDTSSAFASNIPGGLRDLKVDAACNLLYLDGAGVLSRVSYPPGQPQPPQIVTQPGNVTVGQGQSATFTVVATGPSLVYQWQHLVGLTWTDVGTNAASLTLSNVSMNDAGGYRVIVANGAGAVVSNPATLTVLTPPSAPFILTQPISQRVSVGDPAAFAVVAAGTPPLSYTWQHLVGGVWQTVGRNASYAIASASAADAGSYRAVVSNLAGSVPSNTVTLTVNPRPTATITAPAAGATYNWGQLVTFAGSGTGASGGALAPTQLVWQVFFIRMDRPDGTGLRVLPVETVVGASGAFVTSVYDTTPLASYLVVLKAVDPGGGVATSFVDVRPNLARFTLVSNPPGLPLVYDGGLAPSGTTITSVVGEPRVIAAVSPLALATGTFVFNSWSDGGAALHMIITPASDTTYVATYTRTAAATAAALVRPNQEIHRRGL